MNILWENILWRMPTLWGNKVTCWDQGSIQLPKENENVTSRNIKLFLRKPQNNKIRIIKVHKEKNKLIKVYIRNFFDSSVGKESTCNAGDPSSNSWVRKIHCRRDRLPTSVFWPGEFHGLYSLWGLKESDTTEWLSLTLCDVIYPDSTRRKKKK